MYDGTYQRLKYLFSIILVLVLFLSLVAGSKLFSPVLLWTLIVKIVTGTSSEFSLPELIIWELRLPRALLAILIGASLSASGVVAQGIFRNPLADPGVIGVSAGAALLAIIGISLGVDENSLWTIPILAAIGGVMTLFLLFLLSQGRHNFSMILLAGFALSSFFAALISLLLSLQSERYAVSIKIFEWLLGNFEGKGWSYLFYTMPFAGLGLFISFLLIRDLDLLHLGAEMAQSLGSNQRFVFWGGILSVGILVGTVTAMVGMIGFVGLMVPHISRFIVGGMHKKLLTMSVIIGALLMLTIDTLSRCMSNLGLPPGVVTSLIGGPFFLWLIRRQKSTIQI